MLTECCTGVYAGGSSWWAFCWTHAVMLLMVITVCNYVDVDAVTQSIGPAIGSSVDVDV